MGSRDVFADENWNDVSFGSLHAAGAHFLFCDGSVDFISENIELKVYKGISTINSGEPARLDGSS
jgi:prepilin-type processing-associated H-X9-DG protein